MTFLSPRSAFLKWASQFSADAIPLPWVRDFAGETHPEFLEERVGDKRAPWQAALDHLARLGFLTHAGNASLKRMHRSMSNAVPVDDVELSKMHRAIRDRASERAEAPDISWELPALEGLTAELEELHETGRLPDPWHAGPFVWTVAGEG